MARKSKDDDSDKPKKMAEEVRFWLAEIDSAKKREKDYRKEGKRIREIYDGERADSTPFNIAYSNTETLMPALYSAVPRPIVERRYKDDDPAGKAAAVAAQRMLEFLIDTNVDGYETFNDSMKSGTLDALLPGRGITSVKYDAEIEGDVKQYELVCTQSRSWDRTYHGYARKWSKVPWVAHEFNIDKEEATELFGKVVAGQIVYTRGEAEDGDDGRTEDDRDTGERKTALIYQIWDKSGGRKVRYISAHYVDGYLKVEDDPLELTGFFDCPRPLVFLEKTDDLIPTALYILYENQANELNRLTVRIARITEAIKARGVYDTELGDDIANIMQADDNQLVAADKSSSLAAEKGLQNAIWFMPLEVLIQVLRELYAAREQCKQVIYEITGISDILRGATKASETLGAQQIKSQWGTLRIKPKQNEVQRYARDLLRMMLEVAALKFSEDTWAKMTGLPFMTEMQFQQLQAQAKAAQQAAQQGNQQALQVFQQMQQQLQGQITWKAVLTILKDDVQRSYKIDIETNSTVEPEAAEDQKNISDLMTAIGQFLNGVGPLVAQGVMPFQVAQSMLLSITKRFRFGSEIEDQIKQMKPPQPKDESADKAKQAEAAHQQTQQQAAQQQAQATGDKIQANAQIAQLQTQLKQAQADNAALKRDSDLALRELKVQQEEQLLKLEKQTASDSITNKVGLENSKLDHKRQLSGIEAKQAKTEQVVSKTVDSKMGQSVQALGGMIEKLVDSVIQQSSDTKELIQAVRAPRRRKAIRDKAGNISETVDEVIGQNSVQ